ncbi:type II toxin-antitoxin system HipA family toxin [Variovorax sp. E3]|uniref:type II toxin-antitoxin system HipA family toxin n=1 Tax=Variovorax sp. E3 TaxID=1914993 RepID=UPI0018DBAB84|nr:type II toxin-antitoxin system HipA family toxin [Variovorax sp. E3]
MKKLDVRYQGWAQDWSLGTLADDGRDVLFEYSERALDEKLELSPVRLKLRRQAYGNFPQHLFGLPGLIADALPDGWGRLVLDRLARRSGIRPAQLSSLDRLAFVGTRAIGALSFEPATAPPLEDHDVALLTLATEAQRVLSGEESEALGELAMLGGSPHGARPKVLVHRTQDGYISTSAQPGSQAWLVKFQAAGEPKEVCALEDLYAQLARECGVDMPRTSHTDLGPELAAFATCRFDVEDGMRVPTHTLAGLLHANFAMPGSVDYTTFLRATRVLTRDEREVKKAFGRAVFNVVFNNRDDHPKNFSFRLDRDRTWKLAPGYDLTFNEGPRAEHQMDICGEARTIRRADLLQLAAQGGLDTGWADKEIDLARDVATRLRVRAQDFGLEGPFTKRIAHQVDANAKHLMP